MVENRNLSGQHGLKPALVIPTFERPTGLRNAVSSGLTALLPNSELIVVDDGIVHPASATLQGVTDARLRIFSTRGRQGPSAARNLGVNQADADIIFFLDDDDALVPDYISRILDMLCAQMPDCEFGFSATIRAGTVHRKSLPTGPMLANMDLSERLGGLGMGFWIRKSSFLSSGGLDEKIRINEDTEFCLRLAERNALGWYESTPGVVINPEISTDDQKDQLSLTKISDLLERAHVFEFLIERYSDLFDQDEKLRRRLSLRAVKYIAKARGIRAAIATSRRLLPNENVALIFPHLLAWSLAGRTIGTGSLDPKKSNERKP